MSIASAGRAFLACFLLLHRCTGSPAPAGGVFDQGRHGVSLTRLDGTASPPCVDTPPPPPKPLLVAAPREDGEYPALVFLHGYLAVNSYYSQLFRHVASHGFIVVGPQLYPTSGPDATEEINAAAAVIGWLAGGGLTYALPPGVRAGVTKVSASGHSRGGKVAFALALGYAEPKLAVPLAALVALVAVDPVDGVGVGEQTPPPILTGRNHSLRVAAPAMVIGTGLGELPLGPRLPPCAPWGVSHAAFYDELDCGGGAPTAGSCCHLVARDYGHMDMMDHDAPGGSGVCRSGGDREPMRRFVGGATVAFLNKRVGGDGAMLDSIRACPEQAPVVLSVVEFVDE